MAVASLIASILLIVYGSILVVFGIIDFIAFGPSGYLVMPPVVLILMGLILILNETKPFKLASNYLHFLTSWFGTGCYVLYSSAFIPWYGHSWGGYLMGAFVIVIAVLCFVAAGCNFIPRPTPLCGEGFGPDGQPQEGGSAGGSCSCPPLVNVICLFLIGGWIVMTGVIGLVWGLKSHMYVSSILFCCFQIFLGVCVILRWSVNPPFVGEWMGYHNAWLGIGIFCFFQAVVVSWTRWWTILGLIIYGVVATVAHFVPFMQLPEALCAGRCPCGSSGGGGGDRAAPAASHGAGDAEYARV
eukprot:TRINITY_DN23723_c0_g1_i1.p1 TRINITY_DN23723_c0_g1~~TRINITY_DN23723_c0_g1_i1.p1  ORF type:complete len:299 (+),score=27.63 TRINITY_DN23723_c0_g1_i1:102-998(+)